MHFLKFITASLVAIIPLAHALPAASNPTSAASAFVSEICTAPSKHFNAIELGIASRFCSGFLHVKTTTLSVTQTSTLPASTPAAVTQTVTVTSTGITTTTLDTVVETATTLPAVTSTGTSVVTPDVVVNTISTTTQLPESIILDTLAAVQVTITTTNRVVVSSTVTTFKTLTTTTETFEKRQGAPGAFASYAASVISQACSCLVHTPTVTLSYTATSTPAPLVASTIINTATTQITVTETTILTSYETDVLPAPTVQITITTTAPAPTSTTTLVITEDALTSTQTITPSPITHTSSTTTTTTAIVTATTVSHLTVDYTYQLVQGPSNGCIYGANVNDPAVGFIREADYGGTCAALCAAQSGCVAYTTANYVPGGPSANLCFLLSQKYNSNNLNCVDYSDYANEVFYNLVETSNTLSKRSVGSWWWWW